MHSIQSNKIKLLLGFINSNGTYYCVMFASPIKLLSQNRRCPHLFLDLFCSKTAANSHIKILFKIGKLYLVHKVFVEYITIFFVKHLVNIQGEYKQYIERQVGGENERENEFIDTSFSTISSLKIKMIKRKKNMTCILGGF